MIFGKIVPKFAMDRNRIRAGLAALRSRIIIFFSDFIHIKQLLCGVSFLQSAPIRLMMSDPRIMSLMIL